MPRYKTCDTAMVRIASNRRVYSGLKAQMQRKTTITNERYSAVNGDKMKTKNEGSDRKSTQTEEKQEDEEGGRLWLRRKTKIGLARG